MEKLSYYHKVYDLKRDQLSYDEFVKYIQDAVNALIVRDGISAISKDMVFKYYFALYYLDIELPENELEAYPLFCDINFEDYENDIAWNQFKDLKKAFERQCQKVEKIFNKDINDSVVEFVGELTDTLFSLKNTFKDINMRDVSTALTGVLGKLDGMTQDQVLQFVFDKLNEQNQKHSEEASIENKEENKELN